MKHLAYWLLPGYLLLGRPAVAQTATDSTLVPEQWLLEAAPNAAQTTTTVVYAECFPSGPELLSGGGIQGIIKAIQQRVIYPSAALRAAIAGKVYVAFTVTPIGDVTQVVVLKPFQAPYDSAAVNAVRQLPRFKPRPEKYGNVRFTVPIDFTVHTRRSTSKAAPRRNSTP